MNENNKLAEIHNMPPFKAVVSNAVPAMLGFVMVLIYNMADLFFVGQTGDPLDVAAVSLATPMFLTLIGLGTIFGVGGTSVISRSLGAGNAEYAKKVSSFCFWSSIIVGSIFAIILYIFIDEVLVLLGTSEQIWDRVKDYLIILGFSAPFLLIGHCYTNLLRAEGEPKKAITGMLIGNIVNIVLDPIFILWLGMGVKGAAIATLLGNTANGIYYIIYLKKDSKLLGLDIKDFTIKDNVLKSVMLIGIPASIASFLQSWSNMVANNLMSTYGDIPLAGFGVAMKIITIPTLLCLGLGLGVQPLLGYCIGAKNLLRFKSLMKSSLILGFGVSATLTLICYIGLNYIVGIFLTDISALEYAAPFTAILLSTTILVGLFNVYSNALQAMGEASSSLIVNSSRQGIVYIPLLFILNIAIGIDGLVWAQPIADVITFLLVILLYYRAYKKFVKKFAHEDNNIEENDIIMQ
ncbi:MAG: hypothetical protein BEN19_00935 [Epulopiscium sp. Nuni2H_MBin003]|nr:MAG: hypothetical protein BEN19_00935 [Epulopiscium sp. Nuni2H_MBin003]